MTAFVRPLCALLVVVALASGCGGGDEGPDVATEATTPTVEINGPGAPAPGELPLVDLGLQISGPATVRAAPGAEATIAFVFDNPTSATFTARFELGEQDGVNLVGATERVRVGAGSAGTFEVTVGVSADVPSGEELELEVSVVEVGATEHRTSVPVSLIVSEDLTSPPRVGGDDAATRTNERVSSYVVFDDTDPDGDLDVTTVRVIGGGYLAESVTADPSGTITYVPFADLTGVDFVLYEVCDTVGHCGAGVLRVDIQAA